MTGGKGDRAVNRGCDPAKLGVWREGIDEDLVLPSCGWGGGGGGGGGEGGWCKDVLMQVKTSQ